MDAKQLLLRAKAVLKSGDQSNGSRKVQRGAKNDSPSTKELRRPWSTLSLMNQSNTLSLSSGRKKQQGEKDDEQSASRSPVFEKFGKSEPTLPVPRNEPPSIPRSKIQQSTDPTSADGVATSPMFSRSLDVAMTLTPLSAIAKAEETDYFSVQRLEADVGLADIENANFGNNINVAARPLVMATPTRTPIPTNTASVASLDSGSSVIETGSRWNQASNYVAFGLKAQGEHTSLSRQPTLVPGKPTFNIDGEPLPSLSEKQAVLMRLAEDSERGISMGTQKLTSFKNWLSNQNEDKSQSPRDYYMAERQPIVAELRGGGRSTPNLPSTNCENFSDNIRPLEDRSSKNATKSLGDLCIPPAGRQMRPRVPHRVPGKPSSSNIQTLKNTKPSSLRSIDENVSPISSPKKYAFENKHVNSPVLESKETAENNDYGPNKIETGDSTMSCGQKKSSVVSEHQHQKHPRESRIGGKGQTASRSPPELEKTKTSKAETIRQGFPIPAVVGGLKPLTPPPYHLPTPKRKTEPPSEPPAPDYTPKAPSPLLP
ncbi:hypothetical protein BJ742DRAFT_184113 [Cladochytrium replicatum]|nr:hypothetical protein BJ742DRAFT_184113 [Cladochytrium replicatum]